MHDENIKNSFDPISAAMSGLVAQMSGLNPFRFNQEEVDEDDKGDEITQDTQDTQDLGGGTPVVVPKGQLRVSHAIRSFLVQHQILSEHEARVRSDDMTTTPPALREMLERDHVRIPPSLLDRSHPLSAYFISSSHNTYLVAHQLYGESSAAAYETAIGTGSRCVEIDAWDDAEDPDEPKVTHGFTLVSNVRFRAVCERIRCAFDGDLSPQPAPLLISLENHCGPRGQLRLVAIMKEVFGHRLLMRRPVPSCSSDMYEYQQATLEELGGKIVVIVEFHFPDEASGGGGGPGSSNNTSKRRDEPYEDDDSDDGGGGRSTVIIAELAALGVCAQSVKPRDSSWFERGSPRGGPQSTPQATPHLINVSESRLAALLPGHAAAIQRHNAASLMRVYPRGTRITSSNLQAVPFWGVGAQICALNWQTFGTSMQLNRALFHGSEGYVLKPAFLRQGDMSRGDNRGLNSMRRRRRRKKRLILHVAGATDVPIAEERDEDDRIKPYVTCTLHTPSDYDEQGRTRKPLKRKTDYYRQHRFGFLHRGENPPVRDPIWDEVLEWEYDEEEGEGLGFLRMLIKSDDSWAPNPRLVVAAVRLSYVLPGWRFVRMMDLRGRETGCTLLVRFGFEDVE